MLMGMREQKTFWSNPKPEIDRGDSINKTGNISINVILRRVCVTIVGNHCCSGKIISVAYSECVFVALVTQHTKRMRRIILSSVACPAVQYVSILSYKQARF
jgi:hypothetical protein